jgi:hypothetical protein
MVDCIKLFNNYETLTKLSYRLIKLSEVIRLTAPAFLHENSPHIQWPGCEDPVATIKPKVGERIPSARFFTNLCVTCCFILRFAILGLVIGEFV